jgi:hypothetical protein
LLICSRTVRRRTTAALTMQSNLWMHFLENNASCAIKIRNHGVWIMHCIFSARPIIAWNSTWRKRIKGGTCTILCSLTEQKIPKFGCLIDFLSNKDLERARQVLAFDKILLPWIKGQHQIRRFRNICLLDRWIVSNYLSIHRAP